MTDPTRPEGWRTLRIAMASYYLPSDSKIGAGHQAHAMANALTDRGHQVVMFSPCGRVDGARYDHSQVLMGGRMRTFRWANRVRALDLRGFDVLHAHGDDHLRRKRTTPAHVRTLHGSCFDEALHVTGAKERLRMAALGLTEAVAPLSADATVAVSEATRRWNPWVKRVIPNGVDLTRFRPGDDREPTPTILFVGTYGQRKRGWLLADAFEQEVLPRHPEARLWMVCSDAPERPGVEVLGRLSDDELADRYRRATVFCLPSSYEGFGVPYVEAMASGTPVVATPNAGAREVLAGGEYGLLADDTELGEALLRVLESPALRTTLSEAGLERARLYAWPRVIESYERLYLDLLERRRSRHRR